MKIQHGLTTAAIGTMIAVVLTGCGSQVDEGAPAATITAGPTSSSTESSTATSSATSTSTSTSSTTQPSPTTTAEIPEVEPAPTTPTPTATPRAAEAPAGTLTRALAVGATGPQVKLLQQKLLENAFWLPEADGQFGSLTQQAVFAAQKAYGLPRTGVANAALVTALDTQDLPAVQSSGGKAVEISIARQTLTLVNGGKVVAVFNTSTGNGEPFSMKGVPGYVAETPTGTFRVGTTFPAGWQKGDLGEMYKPAYFNGAIAFHGSRSIPPYPASHGCARLSESGQDYIWAQGYAAKGTLVIVS